MCEYLMMGDSIIKVETSDCVVVCTCMQSCNDEPADLRQEQCSRYDEQKFDGGKLYTWKPYTDGQ